MVWKVNTTEDKQAQTIAPYKSLHGHSHFVQDVALSHDGAYALSASWDSTLRLWDLQKMKCSKQFIGHSKDVMSVAFSQDCSKIVSASRDKSIKLWNTLGECKFTMPTAHNEWVSCVRFVPGKNEIVSAGWDNECRTWEVESSVVGKSKIIHHTGYINTIAFSPDGSLMATAGKDGNLAFWGRNAEKNLYEFLYDVTLNTQINAVVFAEDPVLYTCIVCTDAGIFIVKEKNVITAIKTSAALSIAMSSTRGVFFTGHKDHDIIMWKVTSN